MSAPVSRRSVLAGSAGLIVSVLVPTAPSRAVTVVAPKDQTDITRPMFAYISIDTSSRVTFHNPQAEMGQGIMTGLTMLIAQELGLPVNAIAVENAPISPLFVNKMLGGQLTGGSTSMRNWFVPLRSAAATAREMLRTEAARRWAIPVEGCTVADGRVSAEGRGSFTFGELAEDAKTIVLPAPAMPTPRGDWTLLGTSQPRLDVPAKVDGSAVFGIDAGPADALTAVIRHCPVLGGTVKSLDDRAARAIPGVVAVVRQDAFVAVVATNFHTAQKGRAALDVAWNAGANTAFSTDGFAAELSRAVEHDAGLSAESRGSLDDLLKAHEVVTGETRGPFLPHMTMEPVNATARVTDDAVEVWAPTQGTGILGKMLPKLFGVAEDRVKVHVTYLGGGFGRKVMPDFVVNACLVAKGCGRTVKLIYSREEDIQHDTFSPMSVGRYDLGFDADGSLVGMRVRVASPSVNKGFNPAAMKGDLDTMIVEGIVDQPYNFTNFHVDQVLKPCGFTVGYWRSDGFRLNTFTMETAIDAIAARQRVDPLDLRQRLCTGDAVAGGVLAALRDRTAWADGPPPGRARGMALCRAFGATVAQAVEISLQGSQVTVHKVWCVFDVGSAINPNSIRAQIQSGVIDGLNTAFHGGLKIVGGAVQQQNLFSYDWITIGQIPEFDITILEAGPLAGVGEPGVPPVAPALAQALEVLTGERPRRLPFREEGYTLA